MTLGSLFHPGREEMAAGPGAQRITSDQQSASEQSIEVRINGPKTLTAYLQRPTFSNRASPPRG